jgi:hypothetical protein
MMSSRPTWATLTLSQKKKKNVNNLFYCLTNKQKPEKWVAWLSYFQIIRAFFFWKLRHTDGLIDLHDNLLEVGRKFIDRQNSVRDSTVNWVAWGLWSSADHVNQDKLLYFLAFHFPFYNMRDILLPPMFFPSLSLVRRWGIRQGSKPAS